jgi:hypothetical protein
VRVASWYLKDFRNISDRQITQIFRECGKPGLCGLIDGPAAPEDSEIFPEYFRPQIAKIFRNIQGS